MTVAVTLAVWAAVIVDLCPYSHPLKHSLLLNQLTKLP